MNLSDLSLYVGDDLSSGPTGDLAVVQVVARGQQRILRRLLTNPGEYLFHPDYGAGLPTQIGRNASLAEIKGIIRGQILAEAVVARSPEPIITVAPVDNAAGGGISVRIEYFDAPTSTAATLSFDVSR
ncbi:MAG TPA: hypothetical protein VF503_12115 [Sphingobium sp.]|uniref:hypothetical protein n=1 Tax=Sphingobium sp. TaxID=1912891 RepID=UPI002ED3BB39